MAAPAAATLFASLGDQTIAAQVANAALLLQQDRNYLPNHPALYYAGSINGAKSNAIKVPYVGLLGYDALATGTEGDPVGNTDITDQSATITVIQKTLVREPSDLAKMVDGLGTLRPDMLAMDGAVGGALVFRSMVANVTNGFSGTVGTAGSPASYTDCIDAITALAVLKVPGPYLGIVHPVQWGHIKKDVAANSGGAVQWAPGSQLLIEAQQGLGDQGTMFGIRWFVTTDVPTANSSVDRAGGIFGRGAVVWADGDVEIEDLVNQRKLSDKILFERQRVVAGGTTKYATHRYLGVSAGYTGFGVSLITSATQ